MPKKEIAKRYLLFILSLFFSALGIAFAKHGELGISPVSSVANVLSYQFPALSIGSWLIVWNVTLILGQVLVLRKRFKIVQLLQIPLSFLFGWFTDLGVRMVSPIPVSIYPMRLLMVVIGILVLGFGISLAVTANVIMNSGEAFVMAVSETTHKNFGNLKILFDVSCVTLSILLSLLFFHGKVIGTREGTVLTALLTGMVVKQITKYIRTPLDKLLKK